jgi:N-acetylneuraminic acid mutarotase
MAHQVFVSHAREDQAAASRICALLEADGVGCWLASRDATARKDKAAANLQAIRDSDLVLLVFSAWANTSPTVLRDIERAIAYERPVLSIHLDDTVPNPSLEYYLNLWQWLDASVRVEDKREEIIAAVRGHLAQAGDSAQRTWLDAPAGVDSKREEIVAAVRGHLVQIADSAAGQEAGALAAPTGTADLGLLERPKAARWLGSSRRTWGIVLGATLAALALGVGLGLGLTGTTDQGKWTKLDPTGMVPHAPTAPITYDSATRRVIMMVGSGEDFNSPSPVETWAYDPAANTWTELKPAGTVAPPIRSAFAMAYDPTTGRLIVFGGADHKSYVPPDEASYHFATANTWAYDPVAYTWAELKPLGKVPPPRLEGAMAYDPTTRRLILFGGVSRLDAKTNDTWAYDPIANTWTELKPAGTPPPGRSSKMAYDPTTERMILFGSAGQTGALNDTWAYDPVANAWTELKPLGTLPEKRIGFALAYDSSRHRVILFGGCSGDGSTFFNDTWAYDAVANTWTELTPSGALPRACISSLVYDQATNRLIMFAEYGPGAPLNDIWAFRP